MLFSQMSRSQANRLWFVLSVRVYLMNRFLKFIFGSRSQGWLSFWRLDPNHLPLGSHGDETGSRQSADRRPRGSQQHRGL